MRSKFIWTSTQTRDGDQLYAKWSQRRRPPYYGPFRKTRSAAQRSVLNLVLTWSAPCHDHSMLRCGCCHFHEIMPA